MDDPIKIIGSKLDARHLVEAVYKDNNKQELATLRHYPNIAAEVALYKDRLFNPKTDPALRQATAELMLELREVAGDF